MKETLTLESGAIISHYRILDKLGAGGMGEVYLAEDTKLERKVALKVLPSDVAGDRKRMQRFKREARTASALNHPNILTIYDIGDADSKQFMVTEFIEGVTLRQHLKTATMTVTAVLNVAIQTADALSAAHEAGIIHRDVKPENIMVRRRDGYIKVLDFGLAKLTLQPELSDTEDPKTTLLKTDEGALVGTAVYMSPEQARGIQLDARTDIFSLGVVMYEMVAGCLPFDGSTSADILASILSEKQPQPLARYFTDVPVELERIVSKTLRKDRELRYQTTKDLMLDLQSLKQELEFEAKLDRSVAPELKTTAQVGGEPDTVKSGINSAAHVSSEGGSLNHVLARRKVARLLFAMVVILAASAAAYFYFSRPQKSPITSIAVLPFVNDSADPDTEYLSDGITESLINSLSQLPNLKMIASSSVFRYKGKEINLKSVGRDLGVQAILTGRVVQHGDNLTISAELVDVQNNSHLWGEQYNRKLADVLTIQSEISLEISQRLRLKFAGDEQKRVTKRYTEDTQAYQLYLKGRYYWNKRNADGLKKAIVQFQQAIDRDPNYALAYTGLADCYLVLEQYTGFPATETLPKAKSAIDHALQIDDSLSEAHTSLASFYHQTWKWDEAEQEFQRAISLNPNYPTAHHWYQYYLRSRNRLDQALVEIKRAQELDPLSAIFEVNIATVYIMKGDLDAAMEHSQRLIDLDPNYSLAHDPLGKIYIKQHRNAEAIAAFQKDVGSDRSALALGSLGHAYALAGRRDEVQAVLKELQEKYAKHESLGQYIAEVYIGLGDKRQALAWLEKDFQARSGLLASVTTNPLFDSLRSDPGFVDLLGRMGLNP